MRTKQSFWRRNKQSKFDHLSSFKNFDNVVNAGNFAFMIENKSDLQFNFVQIQNKLLKANFHHIYHFCTKYTSNETKIVKEFEYTGNFCISVGWFYRIKNTCMLY